MKIVAGGILDCHKISLIVPQWLRQNDQANVVEVIIVIKVFVQNKGNGRDYLERNRG